MCVPRIQVLTIEIKFFSNRRQLSSQQKNCSISEVLFDRRSMSCNYTWRTEKKMTEFEAWLNGVFNQMNEKTTSQKRASRNEFCPRNRKNNPSTWHLLNHLKTSMKVCLSRVDRSCNWLTQRSRMKTRPCLSQETFSKKGDIETITTAKGVCVCMKNDRRTSVRNVFLNRFYVRLDNTRKRNTLRHQFVLWRW